MRRYIAPAFIAAACLLAPVAAGAAPASPKEPFTITNDPPQGTVVNTMLERTCTGTVVPLWSWQGEAWRVQATWYRRPDGTKWVKFYYNGIGPKYFPVVELGLSAQWITPPQKAGAGE